MMELLVILGVYLSVVQGLPLEPTGEERPQVNQTGVNEEKIIKRVPRHDEHVVTSEYYGAPDPKTLHGLHGTASNVNPSFTVNYNTPAQSQPAVVVSPPKPQVNYLCPHQNTAHVHSYTTTVPYIAGYRLIPIISRKQIILNDPVSYSCSEGTHSYSSVPTQTTISASQPGVLQETEAQISGQPTYILDHDYGSFPGSDCGLTTGGVVCTHGRSWDPEAFLRTFEDSGFFTQAHSTDHGLQTPSYYESRIDELKNHIEHLQSMRSAAEQTSS